MVRDYLLGERRPMIDLMAWNADATRLPYRMHTEYLERLYLNNDLAQRRYRIDGRTIGLGDLRASIFAVGTLKDHVAPWRSVFKIHRLARNSEVTFVLTSGGHNAGIVSPPGHPHRSFQVATRKIGRGYVDPDTGLAETPKQEGSWWPAWQAWLAARSGDKLAAPKLGAKTKHYAPLGEAPGSYVLMP
jgi:polyhydroxyalkanoate synthase